VDVADGHAIGSLGPALTSGVWGLIGIDLVATLKGKSDPTVSLSILNLSKGTAGPQYEVPGASTSRRPAVPCLPGEVVVWTTSADQMRYTTYDGSGFGFCFGYSRWDGPRARPSRAPKQTPRRGEGYSDQQGVLLGAILDGQPEQGTDGHLSLHRIEPCVRRRRTHAPRDVDGRRSGTQKLWFSATHPQS
jgi:hypothetical protein